MAASFNCKCPERKKPVEERDWTVLVHQWNFSAFVKKGGEPSDYSTVSCNKCYGCGRTKAKFVDTLVRQGKVRR